MRVKFLSAFSVVKENFAYLLVIFGLFLVLTVGGYLAISRSFENRLQTEVSIVFDIAKSQIESNFKNFEMGIYEDVFRIQNAFDELQDSARIKSLIRRSTYKRISFITYDNENNIKLDEIDTMCIYGIFKGEAFTTTKLPLNLEGIKVQNWYKKAKAANGALVKNPLHKAVLLGYKDAVSWSKEFFDKDGNSIAVLNFAIPYESYMKIFKAISHFRGGYVFLTDNSNVMLEHPNSEFIGKHILQINQNWKAFVSGNDMSVKDIPNFENVKTYAYKNTVLDDQFMYVVVPLDNYYRDLRFAEVKLVVLCFFCYLILSIILVKLNERKKKADNDNRAKSGFLAVMSHEIRTPLNAIVGLSQLEMEKSSVPSAVKQTFEKILISSKNLLSIINDILDLSKIENEKLKITEDEYDIPSLLNDVLVMSQARIASKPIELKLNISPNIPGRLSGDTLRIKQVLNNFISNAIKYTEKGSVELTVSAEGSSSPNSTNIKFVVKDTGVGIKAEKIQELFTEYNRLDTKKNLTIEGTGLGLAIAKKLSDLMGGTIEVKSKVDSGSEFSFEVPQKVIDSNTIGESVAQNLEKFKYSAENIIANKNMIREKLSGASILVVDDVPMNLDVMRGLLEPYDLHTEVATSGQQAINLIKNGNRYDLVFMDHMMPIMDGIETTKKIRELGDAYSQDLPIVAFTANAMAGNDKMFLGKGFNDFISKPVDIRELDGCLKKWLKRKNEDSSEEVPQSPKPPQEVSSDISINLESQIVKHYIDINNGIEQFGSEENFKKILASFKKHTPALLEDMKTKTGKDYAIAAHSLKGVTRTIFAKELGERSFELEMAAKENNFELVNSKNEDLIRDTKKLIDAL